MTPPSYNNGYAHNSTESLYPELWRKLVFLAVPSVGIQGSRIWDFSGNRHHGSFTGMVAADWTAGRTGYALNLDGTDAVVTVPHHTDFNGGSAGFTVMVWVRADAWGDAPIVWKLVTATARARFTLTGVGGTDIHYRQSADGSAYDVDLSTPIADAPVNEWHHIAATSDGTTARLYIDGLEADSAATSAFGTSTSDLLIGSDGGTEFFDGRFDDLRIYNRCLSEREIDASICGASPLCRGPYPLKQRGYVVTAKNFSATLDFNATFTKNIARTFSATLSFASAFGLALARFIQKATTRDKVDIKHTYRDRYP